MSDDSLNSLLEKVSRSFYRTMRILPQSVRPQISHAYLLARTSDTIADTEVIPLDRRIEALKLFREGIRGTVGDISFQDFQNQQAGPEQTLIAGIPTLLRILREQSAFDGDRMREVLEIIISGQLLDLERFASANTEIIVALQNENQLDDYTYRVAGCVGEFWTKMCRAHVFPKARLDDSFLLANGIRFGKGLQLVNILRDIPEDLRAGRCYLPGDKLAEIGFAAKDLLSPENEPRFRPLYNRYLDLAESHLAAGWDYTMALPWRFARVRLACAWPILIGIQTLAKLRTGKILEPGNRIKISRPEVKRLIARSTLLYPLPPIWRGLFRGSGSGRESSCVWKAF